MTTKRCCICETDKPATLEFFHKRKTSEDGFRCDCKQCRKDKKKKNYNRETKKCSSCEQLLPNTEEHFHRHRGKFARTRSQCKNCHKVAQRVAHLKNRYGLLESAVANMTAAQNNKCAICLEPKVLVVDHDHISNKVRGLLCNECNRGLGFFHDKIQTMKNAINYLENHG